MTSRPTSFQTERRLNFGDCDPSGIAYFPSYLHILIGVIEEFFESLGAPWPQAMRDDRISTPTVRLDLTFRSPGFHGDRLGFTLAVRAVGRSSLDLDHTIASRGVTLWTARHRMVATDLDTLKARPWPEALRAALERRLEPEEAAP